MFELKRSWAPICGLVGSTARFIAFASTSIQVNNITDRSSTRDTLTDFIGNIASNYQFKPLNMLLTGVDERK